MYFNMIERRMDRFSPEVQIRAKNSLEKLKALFTEQEWELTVNYMIERETPPPKDISAIPTMTKEQLDEELRKEIYYSSRTADAGYVAALLEAGANPNQTDVLRYIPWLIYHGKPEVVKILFDNGVDPNFRVRNGRTLAHELRLTDNEYRKINGIKEMFEFIISCGVYLDTVDNDGVSPLMLYAGESISGGIVDILNLILDWEEKHSPSFSANYKSRNEYLTEVLRRYLNTSMVYANIHFDYSKIDTKFIERLLLAGANPLGRDERGALIIFRQQSYSSTIHFESLPLFIERGLPLNETDGGYGRTLLHYAIRQDEKADFIKMLLEKGADPNIKQQGEKGRTPLMITRSLDIAQLLLLHGADPNIKDNDGNTVLHHWAEDQLYGTERPDIRLFNLLMKYGCLIDAVNNEGQTPLMLAIKEGDARSYFNDIYAILEHGASVNHKDNEGNNVLLYFAERVYYSSGFYGFQGDEYKKLAETLLDKGADPAEKNNNGDSALRYFLNIPQKDRSKELNQIIKLLTD